MKKVGYWVFALFARLFRLAGVKGDKVFCIMTHDGSEDSSVGALVQALHKTGRAYRFHYMRKRDRGRKLSFFLIMPYHLATSKYVLLDNVFLPMAYIRLDKSVKVVQLWHGTGSVKKFGQDVNEGTPLGDLERKANARITHLIVNSEYTRRQYQGAFGIPLERIYATGLPRTDALFRGRGTDGLYERHPDLRGKRLYLYAPTFRDDEVETPRVGLDLKCVDERLPDSALILLRLHPHVAGAYKEEELEIMGKGRVVNVSGYSDLNHLLFAADALITDYSSIIFEYCVLEKPMYFFAYDLEEFGEGGRGFYEDYESYVPGPVSRSTEELFEQMFHESYDLERVRRFKQESYRYLDGKSSERLIREVFSHP